MEIIIKLSFKCEEYWNSKTFCAIFVKNESDIDPLFKLLFDQDDYWEHYKKLIKVIPYELYHITQIDDLCEWNGKTDIHDYDDLKKKANDLGIEFVIYSKFY